MKTTIVTRKIEFYVNESDKDLKKQFYQTLRDFSYYTFKHANELVDTNRMVDVIKRGFGNSKNEITSEEMTEQLSGMFGCKPVSVPYKFSNQEFRDKLPSNIRVALSATINALYAKDRSDVARGNRTIRSYKNGMPVPFTKTSIRQFKFDVERKNFTFIFNGIPLITRLGRDRSNNKSILESIIEGKYQLCDSSFQIKDGKFFLLLVHKVPVEKYKLNEKRVLGIDLGINVPLYGAINDKKDRIALGDRDSFLNQRLKFQKRKRQLQRDLKLTKGGKGRGKKLKALESLSTKERNFAKNYNHNLSREVINFALKHKCGIINLEDLSGFKKNTNDFILRNWSFYELQTMIEQKAKKVGITVNKVKAKYTSQRCNNCGYIDKESRKSQSEFECTSCGHEESADYNAAKNISMAHTKEFQKEIEKHASSLKLCEA